MVTIDYYVLCCGATVTPSQYKDHVKYCTKCQAKHGLSIEGFKQCDCSYNEPIV